MLKVTTVATSWGVQVSTQPASQPPVETRSARRKGLANEVIEPGSIALGNR
jgi:hypothetical protein